MSLFGFFFFFLRKNDTYERFFFNYLYHIRYYYLQLNTSNIIIYNQILQLNYTTKTSTLHVYCLTKALYKFLNPL